jgi:hypothetical protein
MWKRSGTGRLSMIGVPSSSAIQPGRTGRCRRCAMRILLPATELMEASNTNGGRLRAGTATAMGLRPSIGRAPNVGVTWMPPTVMATPMQPSAAARWAW